jgi:hypothetical protein
MFHVRPAFLLDEDYRRCTEVRAEQGMSENEALEKGLTEKSAEFTEKGAEVYARG